jgi:hypothetical protein
MLDGSRVHCLNALKIDQSFHKLEMVAFGREFRQTLGPSSPVRSCSKPPGFIWPRQPALVDKATFRPWLHEIKFVGYRMIARKDGEQHAFTSIRHKSGIRTHWTYSVDEAESKYQKPRLMVVKNRSEAMPSS